MLRQLASSMSMLIIGVTCAFATHLILAKSLSASEYGIFSFIFSVSLLLSVVALFGFQNSSVKFISIFQTQKSDDNQTYSFSRFALFFTLSLALALAVLVYGALTLFGFDTTYPLETLIIGAAITPLMVIMRLHAAFIRGFSKPMLSILYETTLREVLFLALIILSVLIGLQLETGLNTLILFISALFIASFASWLHANFFIKKTNSNRAKPSADLKKEWINTSSPMMLVIFAQRLLRRSDIIILGLMVHPALVGAYAIAAQFSEVSSIGQKGIFAIFSPKAAQLHQQDKSADLKTLYRKMQITGIFMTGGFCAAVALLAPYLLQYFGEDYTIAYSALLILLGAQFINICFGPVGILMLMSGYEKTAMRLTIICAIGNILCNPVAIYFYGLEGAAMSTLFFLVLRAFLSYAHVKKKKII